MHFQSPPLVEFLPFKIKNEPSIHTGPLSVMKQPFTFVSFLKFEKSLDEVMNIFFLANPRFSS